MSFDLLTDSVPSIFFNPSDSCIQIDSVSGFFTLSIDKCFNVDWNSIIANLFTQHHVKHGTVCVSQETVVSRSVHNELVLLAYNQSIASYNQSLNQLMQLCVSCIHQNAFRACVLDLGKSSLPFTKRTQELFKLLRILELKERKPNREKELAQLSREVVNQHSTHGLEVTFNHIITLKIVNLHTVREHRSYSPLTVLFELIEES